MPAKLMSAFFNTVTPNSDTGHSVSLTHCTTNTVHLSSTSSPLTHTLTHCITQTLHHSRAASLKRCTITQAPYHSRATTNHASSPLLTPLATNALSYKHHNSHTITTHVPPPLASHASPLTHHSRTTTQAPLLKHHYGVYNKNEEWTH